MNRKDTIYITMIRMFIFFILLFSNLSYAEEIKVKVKGMVCSFCAQGAEKKIKSNPIVEQVSIDLNSMELKIITISGSVFGDKEINSLVEKSGFNVEKIERK